MQEIVLSSEIFSSCENKLIVSTGSPCHDSFDLFLCLGFRIRSLHVTAQSKGCHGLSFLVRGFKLHFGSHAILGPRNSEVTEGSTEEGDSELSFKSAQGSSYIGNMLNLVITLQIVEKELQAFTPLLAHVEFDNCV